jgi:hypothetical protein
MSEFIDVAIDVFEKQIQALYTNDYEKFRSLMTPRIANELTFDLFQKAIELYKHRPIDVDAIDRDLSKFYPEGESDEILEKHVKLVLVGSSRTLCHVVELGGIWLIDDIYWRISDQVDRSPEIKDNQVIATSIPTEEDGDIKFTENPEEDTEERDKEEDNSEEDDPIDE